MTDSDPAPGLYELVVTNGWQRRLEALAETYASDVERIDAAEAAQLLSRHFRDLLRHALEALRSREHGIDEQIAICNRLVLLLGQELEQRNVDPVVDGLELVSAQLLRSLALRGPLALTHAAVRPTFPLAETHLLVNARGEHRVGYELEREIASADSIDLLCSFLLWSGFNQLKTAIQTFLRRPDARMRVITTVYLGATQPRVLDQLHAAGAQIKVSYDTATTRLHAKAWLIGRRSGFTTAYIGSSNLSAAALTNGLEWNVRLGTDASNVIDKFRATFEGYWNDPAFESYEPGRDRARLISALAAQRGTRPFDSTLFDLTPRPFQLAILEKLQSERELHGRTRNLVVAATGTGKTVVAAFDFKRLREAFRKEHGRWPSLLFIAHRFELLDQALGTFRNVLKDSSFGGLLVRGQRPDSQDAVFASIQSLSKINVEAVPPTAWDIVIVDEFHHAAATSYETWLGHLRPWILLGLTATPERTDGQDILHWFGGRVAVELRLWDAIEQGLLAPFSYFALKDTISLDSYWKRNRLDLGALDQVLTGHHIRAKQVIEAVNEYVEDPARMRAIGFCVGRGHARFMAEQFNAAGIRSATVLGDDHDRDLRVQQLRTGDLQALFTVDVLSEGVDIPEADTALLLRPTESSTVFIQQLGRGLRRVDGKRCLTVLDLVATPDRRFRLHERYRALAGGSLREIEGQVESGFPLLPAGCSIQLTEDAREVILASLRQTVARRKDLVSDIRGLGPGASLRRVLDESGLSLVEFYRKRTLTELRREAGLAMPSKGPHEDALAKAIPRLLGFDDTRALARLKADLLRDEPPLPYPEWILILSTLFGDEGFRSPTESLAALWKEQPIRAELADLCDELAEQVEYVSIPLEAPPIPLRIHCHYRQEQIVTALTAGVEDSLRRVREGVWFVEEKACDVLFVQLQKSEKDFSPSTMYKDYAISPSLFHWQSQATTAASHKKARRNIDHVQLGITPLLFVRVNEKDDRDVTNPFLFLGPVTYVSHEGERPLSILWKLRHPMPASFFEEARVAV